MFQEVLARLGPRPETERQINVQFGESHLQDHVETERERSPRRREVPVDQEIVSMGHMRDLLRSRSPTFDGSGTRLEDETLLINMDMCFFMHLYGSNTHFYLVEVGGEEDQCGHQYNVLGDVPREVQILISLSTVETASHG